MSDLYLYDYDFNLLKVFPKHISVNISPNYNSYGTFEAHFAINTSNMLRLLKANEYLFFKYENVYYPVIGFKVYEDIAVYGRTLEWLLTKRTVNAQKFEGKTPEEIARSVVSDGAGDFIALGALKGLGEAQDYAIEQPMTVYDVVNDILSLNELGFRLTVNTSKRFVFSVYKGTDLSLIVSRSNKTAYDMSYAADKQDMAANCGWYEQIIEDMGSWNPKTNTPVLSDSKTDNAYKCYKIADEDYTRFGLECKDGDYLYSDTQDGKWKTAETRPDSVWVYIDNAAVTGARKWETILDRFDKRSEAERKLKSIVVSESVDTKTRRIEYGTDYSIGDTARVQYEYGDFSETVRQRIVGVDIYSDENEKGVRPRFENLKGEE